MNIRSVLAIFIFILLINCQNDVKNKNWQQKGVLSKEYPVDSSYKRRGTILSGNIDTILKFVSILKIYKQNHTNLSKTAIDSLVNIHSNSLDIGNSGKNYIIPDTQYILKEKIFQSNKLAFRALLESKWKKSISFEDYKEYILPYKLTNEIFDDWRDSLYSHHKKITASNPALNDLDSLYQYHRSKTYNTLSSKVTLRKHYPSEENYSWLNLSKEGNCASRCRYAIYHLRAAGAPATYDYIPNWGNRPYSQHGYIGLTNKKRQVPELLENRNNPKNLVDNLNAATAPKKTKIFTAQELPKGLYVQYEKTIPVYRETWSAQPQMKKLWSEVPNEELYPGLLKPNMIDVTAQYLKTATVETSRNLLENKKMAYLATFDTQDWIPVAFTTFNWYGKATFKDVGKNIVYLPMTYNNNSLCPYDDPFILENSGRKKVLVCNNEKRINMRLLRKFPLFSYTAIHSRDLLACRIEGANDADFKDAKNLHTVKTLIFNTTQIDFKLPVNFRYIRIIPSHGQKLRIAEIECFENKNGVYKKLEDVNYKKGILKGQKGNAFDGDYSNYLVGGGVKIDFGASVPVSKIRFTPINDSNYIRPRNEYELFYWDYKWVSAS